MGPPSLLLWFVRRARLFYGLSTGPRLPAGPPRLSTAPARRRPASARLPVVRPRPFLHPSLLSTACPPTRPPRLPAALACRPACPFLHPCCPPPARPSHRPAPPLPPLHPLCPPAVLPPSSRRLFGRFPSSVGRQTDAAERFFATKSYLCTGPCRRAGCTLRTGAAPEAPLQYRRPCKRDSCSPLPPSAPPPW